MHSSNHSSAHDWAAVITQFTSDTATTSSEALPSPVQLSRWTVAKTLGLLAARTDPPGLLINGQPALTKIAALPTDHLVGSFLAEVELGIPERDAKNGSARSSVSKVRMPLADAVDFVVREAFSTLHGLRLRRLRPTGVPAQAATRVAV
ncbi:MAG: hypothetical protein HZA92_12685 [Verrucomicrobia bacterium]|nr:hypothetical protein [Verrucomicrobiota bacterium]